MKRLVIALLFLPLMMGAVTRKQATRRNVDKAPVEQMDELAEPLDSCQVTFSRYDKPLRSRWETVQATNHTSHQIERLEIEISYYDAWGTKIHQRTLWLKGSIPASETRTLKFKSWDPQQTFYYYMSPPTKAQNVSRYSVKIRPLRAIYDCR